MTNPLIPYLSCPLTGADLVSMSEAGLQDLNARIAAGLVYHAGGGVAQVQLAAALTTDSGDVVYPVVDDILVLLPTLALISEKDLDVERLQVRVEMDAVREFYDSLGWQQGDDGSYADAELFEDLRPVSAEYLHACHMRVNRYLTPSGRFMLDVASGPVQYEEYLTYSEKFDYRVCGDISITALREAKKRLGQRGLYVQCDITRMPFKDGAMDSFVSLHTVYHVPADRQIDAFRELERVLAPGGSGVVVYSWGSHSVAMLLLVPSLRKFASILLPRSATSRIKRAIGSRAASRAEGTGEVTEAQSGAEEQLYFSPHSYRWFARTVARHGGWDVRVWRSVSVPFLKRYVKGERGRRFLRRLISIEDKYPRFCGRLGQYPLLVYRKTDA